MKGFTKILRDHKTFTLKSQKKNVINITAVCFRMSQDLDFFKDSGKTKLYSLLSDSTVDRPNLSSHEINDRNPPMTMGADTKVLPGTIFQ